MFELKHQDYTVEIETPQIYVDNESRKRSGHMTHALAQFAPDTFIDFNSNCSALRWSGHSPYGFIEYRISKDSGKTYGEVKTLPYSIESFLDGIYAISVEKAVACDDGTIVAFCLRNSAENLSCCEPWHTPTVITSSDGGESWSAPYELNDYKGRVYDAVYKDGIIYALQFCNQNFLGSEKEHLYRIFTSEDNGKSFKEWCIIPFETKDHSYASLLFDQSGNLHAYSYNASSEQYLDHAISYDNGKNWTVLEPCFIKEGARNPQIALVDGVYILHGRAQDRKGFMIYSSPDGQNWDEGVRLAPKNHLAGAFYSNNLNLKDENGEFLLVQFSETYTDKEDAFYVATVNVMHTQIRIRR